MLAKLIRRLAFGSLDFHVGQKVCVDTWEGDDNRYMLGTVTKVVRLQPFLTEELRYEVLMHSGHIGIFSPREVGTIIED